MAPAPPPVAAPPLGLPAAPMPAFSIQQSPFSAAPGARVEAMTLEQAIAAATQTTVAQPPSPAAGQDQPAAKRPRSADPSPQQQPPPPPQHAVGGRQRPPRPPLFAEGGALLLDLGSLPLPQAPAPGAKRSPRSSPSGVRRPVKQMSKTMGRVCIECSTTTTTQWRSQGLLCNSCGVKLIKGRLPMDAEAMQRRWLRLPAHLREHPMWAAAQVVAETQKAAARAAAAGEPWSCPGCSASGVKRLAGPCGIHMCPACLPSYGLPAGGAAAVAAQVTAPPAGLASAGPGAAAAAVGSVTPSPSPVTAGKRRKQPTPRSASGGLSPVSLNSSDSSSIQAYSWQSVREGEEHDDVASSRAAATPGSRPPSARRPRPSQRAVEAAAAAAMPSGTPTAAEAAAALLVLTESDEMRMAAAAELDRAHAAAIAAAAGAAEAAATAAAAAAPARAGSGGAAAEPGLGYSGKGKVATSLDLVMQLVRKHSQAAALAAAAPPPAALAAPAPPAVPAPGAVADSVQLYQQLISATGAPGAAAAGLDAELVGKFMAAHSLPAQTLAAAGGAAGSTAGAAIRAQQEQQAQLVSMMVAEQQFTAVVALMRSVVQLAGLESK